MRPLAPFRAGLALALLPALALTLSASAPAPRAAAPAALPAVPPAVWAESGRVSESRLRTDVEFLSDDLFEGRGTGTRGYDLAARYVAARVALLGVEPAGRDGFLTPVPFRRARTVEESSALALVHGDGRSTPLVLGTDAMLSPDFTQLLRHIEAPLVFVGYGVAAPELGHDDFAGLDVRGKVVVQFRGAPPRFPHNERAYYSNSQVKDAQAVERGAVGTLTVLKPADAARMPWDKGVRQSRLPGFRWLDADGAPANVQPALAVSASLSESGVGKLFAGAPRRFAQVAADAESSVAGGFDLPLRLRATRASAHATVASPNVVGLVRGSDPALARECIVVSAHLDHLGISAPVHGDSINNGAYDNATGTAMLLELARAFRALPRAPRRSILFLAVTAEEKGLQGSDHFARHAAPHGLEVVGNINLDMIVTLTPMTRVVLFGGEHSSLGPVFERAARAVGLEPVPDPMPHEVVFVRSDQFSFVKQGIPGIFPVSGGDGSAAGQESMAHWRVEHYHAPSDEHDLPFDWPSQARFCRMALLGTWMVADQRERPRWNPGDFFGRRFARPL
jgi:Zn-dependent M28 family amino/carboxypeptidase